MYTFYFVWEIIYYIFSFIIGTNVREYCHLDTFNATCPHGNVIMMESALYGRMRIGRCLKTTYFVGCYADVLPHMDNICSGKRSCLIKTVDSELLKFHPCRKDLMPYLEARFKCIRSKYYTEVLMKILTPPVKSTAVAK